MMDIPDHQAIKETFGQRGGYEAALIRALDKRLEAVERERNDRIEAQKQLSDGLQVVTTQRDQAVARVRELKAQIHDMEITVPHSTIIGLQRENADLQAQLAQAEAGSKRFEEIAWAFKKRSRQQEDEITDLMAELVQAEAVKKDLNDLATHAGNLLQQREAELAKVREAAESVILWHGNERIPSCVLDLKHALAEPEETHGT